MLTEDEIGRLLDGLKVGKNGENTRPHKFLFLLCLISFIEKNEHCDNKFRFDELEPVFMSLVREWVPEHPHAEGAFQYPFVHMESDGFWHLKVKKGKEKVYQAYGRDLSKSKTKILETVDYGFLSDDMFAALKRREIREAFKNQIKVRLKRNVYTGPEVENHAIVSEKKSLFEHEQQAVDKICAAVRDQIPSAKCVNNVLIWDPATKDYYEYDLIILARSGIYVVELKHWTGKIEIREYQWRVDETKYRVDPHQNNNLKCKILKGMYQHHFVTYPQIWVESVVVLTNPEATVLGADLPEIANQEDRHNLTFASIVDFIYFLKRREASLTILDDHQVNAVAAFIDGLGKPKRQTEYTVPGYETVEYLSRRPECIEMLARPLGVKGNSLHRLRIFRFIQESKSERERFRKIALNTLDAVQQIGDHPFINKVSVLQNDEGDIIEISEWSDTGTLQDLIADVKGPWPLKDVLNLCKNVALALKEAHEKTIIHRALKPKNILIKNGVPKLMNFDLSFQLEDNRLTVIPDATRVEDDGYVAPEILSGEDIDESTDFFSLGVIAYQLLTGVKPFKSTREFVAHGGELSLEERERLNQKGIPQRTIDGIVKMTVADRRGRLKEAQAVLSAFTLDESSQGEATKLPLYNPILQPGDTHDVYEIMELIDKGRETQIYRARAPRGRIVVLKVFNYETPLSRIYRELDAGTEINSPYVVRFESQYGHWRGKRYFLIMDYVPGKTLRQMINDHERPDRATFNNVVRSLMEGVRAFHQHKNSTGMEEPLVHGDIKPDNIIITSNNKPVLIDLGLAGPPRVEAFHGTSGYVPPDSIKGADRDFTPASDLFALGVTLWEWLFGQKPYENPRVGDKATILEDLPEFRDLYPWLLKAVATEPGQSFATINEMWDAFIKSSLIGGKIAGEKVGSEMQEKEVLPVEDDKVAFDQALLPTHHQHNSFVTYLNTLSCASAGNENAIAECQVRNELFTKIHVPNPVTEHIYQLLSQGNNVILTGNAGDGKTTIAVDVLQRVSGRKIREIRPREEIADHNLVIIKDMSELPSEDRPRIIKEAFESGDKKYLIVSNTGNLRAAFHKFEELVNKKFDDLVAALEASEPTKVANDRFYLINIGQLDSIDTACEVLRHMLEPENWAKCEDCKLSNPCPILSNVRLLRSNLEIVIRRIYFLYKRLYEYGQRLTMRHMTGHLAYAITGGLDCSAVAQMSLLARRNQLRSLAFFNRFFGDDGDNVISNATEMMPIRIIRESEFGTTLVPKFERQVWLKQEISNIFSDEARSMYEALLGYYSSQPVKNQAVFRLQVRRLAYFFGQFNSEDEKRFVSAFLDSPMLLDYLNIVQENSIPSPSKLRKLCTNILHILQEHFIGLRLPEEWRQLGKDLFITLQLPGKLGKTQMILARVRQDDFELVVRPRYSYGNRNDRNAVFLTYRPAKQVELEVDLPFFDYVARRYEGEMTRELSAYYANRLENFRGQLLNACERPENGNNLHLLRIGLNRGFEELSLVINKDKLEVI